MERAADPCRRRRTLCLPAKERRLLKNRIHDTRARHTLRERAFQRIGGIACCTKGQ